MEIKINEKIKNYSPNYLATICKLSSFRPIVNADKLKMATVNGHDIIVSNDFKEGDIVIYFPCESALSEKFLSINNLYELSSYELNANASEVAPLKESANQAKLNCEIDKYESLVNEIKKRCGFFNKYGRVCLLKLRGEYSDGFITKVDTVEKILPNEKNWNWEEHLDEQFNELNGELLCWKYIPINTKEKNNIQNDGQRRWRHRMKKLNRFDRLIHGEYVEHFDTVHLGEHIFDLNPEDIIHISVKIHGSLGEFCNILVRRPLSTWEKVKKIFGCKINETEYGNVYSSHHVIKSRYVNPNVNKGFYGDDIWYYVNEMLKPYIEKGMTIYGEICGYKEGTSTFIQKNHDYGAKVGQWRFMPYRITTSQADGKKFEWNVSEVCEWTNKFIKEHPEFTENILPMTVLYHGKFKDLYPDIEVNEDWYKNVLARMKTDFGLEKDEPLCKNKVPREGIVIRIDNDKYARAWKLKSMAHYNLEKKQHDSGESDIEEIS